MWQQLKKHNFLHWKRIFTIKKKMLCHFIPFLLLVVAFSCY